MVDPRITFSHAVGVAPLQFFGSQTPIFSLRKWERSTMIFYAKKLCIIFFIRKNSFILYMKKIGKERVTMTVGEKIKKIRKEKGMSQKELSGKLGTTPQNLAQYENGKRNPKFESLRKIADVLEVDVMEFVKEQQSNETTSKMKKSDSDRNWKDITSVSFSIGEYTTDEMNQILNFAQFLKKDHGCDVNTEETGKEMYVAKLKQGEMQNQEPKKSDMNMELLAEVRRLQKLVRKYENEKSKFLEHIWVYKIEEWGCGVIFADDEDEAKERLIDTMSAKYPEFGAEADEYNIYINGASECEIHHPTHPYAMDVIECD